MLCRTCKNEIPDGSVFCPCCGKFLNAKMPAVAPVKNEPKAQEKPVQNPK